MALKATVQTFDRDIDLLLDETLSPQAFSREFGRAARQIIEAQDAKNDAALRTDVQYDTLVDGKPSRLLETARNRIVAEWDLLPPIFTETLRLLREAAPVLDGDYRDSIQLFAGNDPVAIGPDMPKAAEYYFAATVPYARKIERGLSSQAPNGVFEAVAAVAAKRYTNVLRVRFGFRTPRAGAIADWAGGASVRSAAPSRNRAGSKRQDWLTRQPAVIFQLR